MNARVILLADQRAGHSGAHASPGGTLADTRGRLSTEGKLYTCLFAQSGHDLRVLMRSGKSDAQIAAAIGLVWSQRADRYSEIRTEETARMKKIEMSYIGG